MFTLNEDDIDDAKRLLQKALGTWEQVLIFVIYFTIEFEGVFLALLDNEPTTSAVVEGGIQNPKI